jgi:hypothetical protein
VIFPYNVSKGPSINYVRFYGGRGVLEISDIHTKSFYFVWELSDMRGGGSEKCQKSPDVINGRPLISKT